MTQNVLDDLLAEAKAKLEWYDFRVSELKSLLEEADTEQSEQVGVVRGIELAIERLAGQPAQGD